MAQFRNLCRRNQNFSAISAALALSPTGSLAVSLHRRDNSLSMDMRSIIHHGHSPNFLACKILLRSCLHPCIHQDQRGLLRIGQRRSDEGILEAFRIRQDSFCCPTKEPLRNHPGQFQGCAARQTLHSAGSGECFRQSIVKIDVFVTLPYHHLA